MLLSGTLVYNEIIRLRCLGESSEGKLGEQLLEEGDTDFADSEE